MKLTKDDLWIIANNLEYGSHDAIEEYRKLIPQILKNQEKAEKYDKHWCVTAVDFEDYKKIVERLKKRIEELKQEGLNDVKKRANAYNKCIELQKILDGKE